MKQFISVAVLFCGLVTSAVAHNVVSGVYGEGLLIEGEIGFSNGEMAQAGVTVNVFDESGVVLGQVTLDDNGSFTFQASSVQKHVFEADLGAGHVAKMVLEADELSAGDVISPTTQSDVAPSTPSAKAAKTEQTKTSQIKAPQAIAQVSPTTITIENTSISTADLQKLIRSAVAQQVRPLQKELQAYKEKVMFRDITGGLGFIFGLFGVAAWMASKRHEKKA